MTRILIADAGSTKTDWVLLSDNAEEERVSTVGYNALLTSESAASDIFTTVRKVENLLCRHTGATHAVAASDLLGAARGLSVHERGIACILGTGSNSCLYDGEKILRNTPSLGFILGDEGSGSALGKRLIADIYKGVLPTELCEKFRQQSGLSVADVLEHVYRQPAPNKFLASFVPFIKENIEQPRLRSLVEEEFSRFFCRNIAAYEEADKLPINFIGGIANAFADILTDVAEGLGYRIGKILKSPIEGLIAYHTTDREV
jgi:N-acetylglucosamine kinase-like BadF-type ATPase